MVRFLLSLLFAVACFALAIPASAWSDNRITGDDVRVDLDTSGTATVEHRLAMRLNGNERQRSVALQGVDPDAVALPNAYVVPAAEALGNSLASAVPLKVSLADAPLNPDGSLGGAEARDLQLDVDDDKGLARGAYVFVFRYRTDLKGRGLLRREGALMLVEWRGPRIGVGLDNARVVFSMPPAPTPPRAAELDDAGEGSAFLSELRRSSDADELELVRTYAPEGARITWTIRADPRAVEGLPPPVDGSAVTPPPATPVHALLPKRGLAVLGGVLFFAFALLVGMKSRQVQRLASAACATMPTLFPGPEWLRIPLAAATFVAGLWFQLVLDRPIPGALLVVGCVVLSVHGTARVSSSSALRGPGRWLAVSEREALVELPRARGAPLDVATREGKAMFVLCLLPFGIAAAWLRSAAPHQALLVGLDSVAVLAVFGTGRMRTLPPDLAVEPAPFFRRLVQVLRKRKGSDALRLVPRVRIPTGEVDADELRLLVVPRLPLRGFTSIEVAMTFALGFGARVAMPEILVRVVAGSPCDQALAAMSRHARITPGRKAEERVFTVSPRLPTVAMTAEILAALAARVTDVAAVRAQSQREIVKTSEVRPRPKSEAA
jgi:hypothetical protein